MLDPTTPATHLPDAHQAGFCFGASGRQKPSGDSAVGIERRSGLLQIEDHRGPDGGRLPRRNDIERQALIETHRWLQGIKEDEPATGHPGEQSGRTDPKGQEQDLAGAAALMGPVDGKVQDFES